jgi:TetR/AcrR family transcriptional regulator, copper-responsive repressor
MYHSALAHYESSLSAQLVEPLSPARSIYEGLLYFDLEGVALFLDGDGPARGCFAVLCKAATEARTDTDTRAALAKIIASMDKAFEQRIALELPVRGAARDLAKIASATVHSLAIRARGEESRTHLVGLAKAGAALIANAVAPT